MLYNNFIYCIMTCGGISLISMIINHDWQYILLPIGILIWGFYKLFNDNDEEYRRRHPYDYSPYNNEMNGKTYSQRTKTNGNTITWGGNTPRVEDEFDFNLLSFGGQKSSDHTRYQPNIVKDVEYKGMTEKCKRNFKIEISK